MPKDAATVAALWAQRLAAAQTEIAAGVDRVTEAPGAKAAQNADKWIQRTTAARSKWIRNTSAVSLQSWQTAMKTKGVPRVGPGAQAALPKMTQFMNQWLPWAEQGAQTVRNMPSATLEDGIARATAQIRHNAQFVRAAYNNV